MSVPSSTPPPSSRPVEPRDEDRPVAGAPSDNTTLVDITAALREQGYTGSLNATANGMISCSACGTRSAASSFSALQQRRLEGASDPADELLVLAGPCSSCGTRGVLLLGFGPSATEADVAVLDALPTSRR